jgi:hypothetical protein
MSRALPAVLLVLLIVVLPALSQTPETLPTVTSSPTVSATVGPQHGGMVLELPKDPIPVGGPLRVVFPWDAVHPAVLSVYNVSWSPAAKKRFTTRVGENVVELTSKRFVPGVYYARLEVERDGVKVRSELGRFVVQR